MSEKQKASGVRAARITLRVFETIGFAQEPLGVSQISKVLDVSKGAIFRHLQELVDSGFVEQDPITTRYRLGVKASLIAKLAPPGIDVVEAAEVPMREAAEALSISSSLTTPTLAGPLVLKMILGNRMIEIGMRPGTVLTYNASANGKVTLAFGPPNLMEIFLKQESLQALTEFTITDKEELKNEISKVKELGYAVAPEETILGINTIAAPVFDMHNEFKASVSLFGLIQYVPKEPDSEMIDVVLKLGKSISRNLGCSLTF